MVAYTVPGRKADQAADVVGLPEDRLNLCGTPGALVAQRDWDDYSAGRAGTCERPRPLGAPDGALVTGGAKSERKAARRAGRD